jgi:hypothetical protein
LLEEIRAIARHPRHLVAKVDVGSFLEDLDLTFGGNFVDHRLEFVVLERWIIDPDELTVYPEHRRIVCSEMKVGCLLLAHQFEE